MRSFVFLRVNVKLFLFVFSHGIVVFATGVRCDLNGKRWSYFSLICSKCIRASLCKSTFQCLSINLVRKPQTFGFIVSYSLKLG